MTPWSCPRCRLSHLLVPTASSPRCFKCDELLERVHDAGALVEACDQEHGELAATCADCGRWVCLSCKEPCPASTFRRDVAVRCTGCTTARAN